MNNFICEVRCPLEQNNGDLLLDFSGEVRSTVYGDPVAAGMGIIPVLPSEFGLEMTAIWNQTDIHDYRWTYPLTLGHDYVCESGKSNKDNDYFPKLQWYRSGGLYFYFQSPSLYFYFSESVNLEDGDEMTLRLEIYEDRFYANYTVNGNILRSNAEASFDDGGTCEFSTCSGRAQANYRQKEQY